MKKCFLILLLGLALGSCTPQSIISTPSKESSSTVATSSGILVEEVARGLFVPWDLVFTSHHRILVTERNGAIREIRDGVLQSEPLLRFDDVYERGESGLLGIVLHPNYTVNKFVYVSLVLEDSSGPVLRVQRLRDEGTRLVQEKIIIDKVPTAQFHAGSRLVFGPDGFLYVTTGDGTRGDRSQDDTTLAGKVLRMTDEGALPPGQRTYVAIKGIRNTQGLIFLDEDTVFMTDHGPSGFDGPGGGDELNIGKLGDNFGWPLLRHEDVRDGFVRPAKVFTPAIAPASAALYSGKAIPAWAGNVFVGMLRGEGLLRVVLEKQGNSWRVVTTEKVAEVDAGRIRTVREGPDGALYFTTSNRDGRGGVLPGDDKVFRLRLKEHP